MSILTLHNGSFDDVDCSERRFGGGNGGGSLGNFSI